MRVYSSLFCALALLLLSLPPNSSAQTATINAGTVYQTIDGFGAATHQYVTPLTDAQAALLFSTTPGVGVGLSLMRSEVPDDGSCTSVNSTCAGASLPLFSDMQKASSYGVKIWSTPWSPPVSMNTNGNLVCNSGGTNTLASGSYGAYATYLSNYIKSVQAQGLSLYGLSIQNEPDFCPNYDGAIWSAQNFHDFILNNLGPTMTAQGQSGVKIIMPETEGWGNFTSIASTTMNDSAAAAYVGVVAFHGYDNSSSVSNPYSAHLWETEDSTFDAFDPSMSNGLMWANTIQYMLTSGHVSAWHYWLLQNYGTDNQGLLSNTGVVAKRLYVLGNWSLFVRPGWVMIGATNNPQSGVEVSAFNNPSTGAFAIVAVNSNGSSISQPFSLSGLSTSSVTPYLTDANNNLAAQSAIPVSGNSFTATLNASSVTTFVGSGNAPGAPTSLAAIVVQ